ncbi:MAG: hypothetical protein AAGG38_10170 [Planctomycetota bacterium]
MNSRFGIRGLLIAVTLLALGLITVTPRLVTGQPKAGALRVSSSSLGTTTERFKENRGEIDPALYTRVNQVRQAIGLTRADLAAMNLDEAGATALLTKLLNWCDQKGRQFARIESDLRESRAERARLLQEVNAGTAPAGWRRELKRLDKTHARAQESRRGLFEQAEAFMDRSLTQAQNNVRVLAKTNRGRGGALRYIDVAEAKPSDKPRGFSNAKPVKLQKSQDRVDQRLAKRLTRAQRQRLQEVTDTMDARWDGVSAAEFEVFSTPEAGPRPRGRTPTR